MCNIGSTCETHCVRAGECFLFCYFVISSAKSNIPAGWWNPASQSRQLADWGETYIQFDTFHTSSWLEWNKWNAMKWSEAPAYSQSIESGSAVYASLSFHSLLSSLPAAGLITGLMLCSACLYVHLIWIYRRKVKWNEMNQVFVEINDFPVFAVSRHEWVECKKTAEKQSTR